MSTATVTPIAIGTAATNKSDLFKNIFQCRQSSLEIFEIVSTAINTIILFVLEYVLSKKEKMSA